MTFLFSQGTSDCQQTGTKDRKEIEGGDDAGRGREETRRPVQRTGRKINDILNFWVKVSHISKHNSIAGDRALNNHLMGVREAKLAFLIVPQGTNRVLKNHPKISDLSNSVQSNPNPTRHLCVHWEGRVYCTPKNKSFNHSRDTDSPPKTSSVIICQV